ncbi:hypothetical protein GCM10010211_64150 [Streptomyces albospinus]|uniref:DUF3344 domain-containing protein n=1 Tax=Streptomyces albospinus TaxID=285515 RepID=A0ABQ2VIE9_9ACTN|nr:DUF3344 domain-containing protein [Streptomyces albospinus]GGU88808.1 hypothetical protein GCM10010211_64150 [Streptomyces albospinus]
MRKSMDRTGRGAVCALAALGLSAVLTSAAAAPAPKESLRIPFGERFHATQHGGIARAANSSVSAPGCRPAVRRAGPSCAASPLRLPAGSRVSYARLYWGGSLRAGGRKLAGDTGRVLLAVPGGRSKEVRADGAIGHRRTSQFDAYQASADVTGLVRQSGPGRYTVARMGAAEGRSRAGAPGGWTLVAVYENTKEPLRRLSLWDGFEVLGAHQKELAVQLKGLRIPAHSRGTAGVVGYNGDPGNGNNGIAVSAGKQPPVALQDSAEPAHGTRKPAPADFGRETARTPGGRNTPGFGSAVYDLTPALRSGGDRLTFRFTTRNTGYLLGALFVQTDPGH